jgi:hypothetical protein
LRERRIVGAFVRMHPLLPLPHGPFADRGRLVQHGETVWIDLTLSAEELWRQTRPGHRNEIGRARRSGAAVEIEGTWRHLDDFQRAYTATMHRVGASHYYFFPRDYFHALRDRMPGVFHLCVVRVGDEFACGGLFSEVGGIVQYHLSASRTEFAKHFPSKLMLDFVRGWAKERGNRALHLGGGLGSANDSLLLFKAGFSHLRTPFHTWRAIADEQAYESLRSRWQLRAGSDADALDGFFPAYRKPLPEPRRAVA